MNAQRKRSVWRETSIYQLYNSYVNNNIEQGFEGNFRIQLTTSWFKNNFTRAQNIRFSKGLSMTVVYITVLNHVLTVDHLYFFVYRWIVIVPVLLVTAVFTRTLKERESIRGRKIRNQRRCVMLPCDGRFISLIYFRVYVKKQYLKKFKEPVWFQYVYFNASYDYSNKE